jgi:methyl-accepting chemotaxis protein
MDRDLLLLYIMAVFTGVAAIALVIQMCFLFGMYRSLKALRERATAFMDRWEPLADQAQKTMEEVRAQSDQILQKVQSLADQSKSQLDKVDTLLTDVSQSTRLQLERIDRAIADTVDRVHETTEALQKTVLVPVRQVRAVAAALGAIVGSLNAHRRPTVDRATLDEEMFI